MPGLVERLFGPDLLGRALRENQRFMAAGDPNYHPVVPGGASMTSLDPRSILAKLKLLSDYEDNVSRVGTGAAEALGGQVLAGADRLGIAPSIPRAFVGDQLMARQALAGFQGSANQPLLDRLRAANEAGARNHAFEQAIANQVTDPLNYTGIGEAMAARRGLTTLAKVLKAADVAQNVPLEVPGRLAGTGVRYVDRELLGGAGAAAVGRATTRVGESLQSALRQARTRQLLRSVLGEADRTLPAEAVVPTVPSVPSVKPVVRPSLDAMRAAMTPGVPGTPAASAPEAALAPSAAGLAAALPATATPAPAGGAGGGLGLLPSFTRLASSGAGAAGGLGLGAGAGALLPAENAEQRREHMRRGAIAGGLIGGGIGLAAGDLGGLPDELGFAKKVFLGKDTVGRRTPAQLDRIAAVQDAFNTRAADDAALHEGAALQAYQRAVPTGKNFDGLWSALVARLPDLRTLSLGFGDYTADQIKKIADSGGIVNGFELHGQRPGEPIPQSLLDAKAAAIGMNPGEPRYNEAITWGKIHHITDPAAAVRAYAAHFLETEGHSYDLLGAGNPLTDPRAVPPIYANLGEGQPLLMQMGGNFQVLYDPRTTPYVGTWHHPFGAAREDVLPMHMGTAENFRQYFGKAATAAFGRPETQAVGQGVRITGSPLFTGPKGATTLRAMALILGAPAKVLKRAAKDPERAALELLRADAPRSRGTGVGAALRQQAAGKNVQPALTHDLAGIPSGKRSEAMILDPDPRHMSGIHIKSQTIDGPKGRDAMIAAAQYFREQMGRPDLPITVAHGPEGYPTPGVLQVMDDGTLAPSTLAPGRGQLIADYTAKGLENLGAIPPRLLETAAGGLGGAGVGTIAGATQGDTPEEHLQNALKGAAIGGLVGGNVGAVSPELLTAARALPAAASALPAAARAVGGAVAGALPGPGSTWRTVVGEGVGQGRAAQARANALIGTGGAGSMRGLLPGLKDWGALWRQQTTESVRNLLQDESWGRLVIRALQSGATGDIAGLRDEAARAMTGTKEWDKLPASTQGLRDAIGKTGTAPVLGQSLSQEVRRGATISTLQHATGAAALNLLNPAGMAQNVLGAAGAGGVGAVRPFLSGLFRTINDFQQMTFRWAAYNDELTRNLATAAEELLPWLQRQGFNVSALPTSGAFDAKAVEAVAGKRAGAAWQKVVDSADDQAQQRVRFLFGDYGKQGKVEKLLGGPIPFMSWLVRAYPVAINMALDHPVVALGLFQAMRMMSQGAGEGGRPDYTAGQLAIPTDTPYVGPLVSALVPGNQGVVYVDPIGSISPVGGEIFQSGATDPSATWYEKGTALLSRAGLPGPNPGIQAATYVAGLNPRMPGALSRTAGIENAAALLPESVNPRLPATGPNLLAGARRLVSPVTGPPLGGEADPYAQPLDPIGRRYAELVFQQTRKTLEDPANRQYLLLMTDPDNPLMAQARRDVLATGAVRNAVSFTSPIGASGQGVMPQRYLAARQAVPFSPTALAGASDVTAAPMLSANAAYQAQTPILGMYRASSPGQRTSTLNAQTDAANAYLARTLPKTAALRKAQAKIDVWEIDHKRLRETNPAEYQRQRDAFIAKLTGQ